MTVPSNLVPTKITGLPIAPNLPDTATVVVVIEGVTYQAPLYDALTIGFVPSTREINTGAGLTGGGNLTQDRTVSIADNGVTLDLLVGATASSVLLGRGSASGAGDFEEITLGTGLTLTGKVLSAPENGTVTSVGVSGGTTGLTVSGSPVTSAGTMTLSGTLVVANGGTGTTTSTGTGSVVLSNSPALVTPGLGTPSAAVLTHATGLPISTGVAGLGTGVATFLGTPSSANLAAAVTDETGSGALVFATSPALVTPDLGTPSAAVLTHATGLPISTGVAGLGTGVATFLGTPSSANLAAAVTNETGSGALVFATSPALVTPDLGTPSAGNLANCTGLPGTLTWSALATGATATVGSGYLCDTSGSGFTLTLPAAPTVGGVVGVIDATGSFDNNSLTLGRNSLPIMGSATDMTVSTENASFFLVYDGATLGWRIFR